MMANNNAGLPACDLYDDPDPTGIIRLRRLPSFRQASAVRYITSFAGRHRSELVIKHLKHRWFLPLFDSRLRKTQ
jgi:hypothetical protein